MLLVPVIDRLTEPVKGQRSVAPQRRNAGEGVQIVDRIRMVGWEDAAPALDGLAVERFGLLVTMLVFANIGQIVQ